MTFKYPRAKTQSRDIGLFLAASVNLADGL